MVRAILISFVAAILLVGCGPARDVEPPVGAAPVGATLLEGLGDYSMPVQGASPEVQRWFDQGFSLTYGFNHEAAERSYLKAAELDPSCAMCWWGAALVLGPHVNAGMDPSKNAAAWERIQRAQSLSADSSVRERALIEALSTRYAANPPADRMPLDQAYANAMATVVERFPDDPDVAVLYAESLMNLQPWDYWDADGTPKGDTAEVVAQLERVMDAMPDHAGALHLYIHAVEASNEPERGAAAADRLRGLLPGSGHLVHMPAHIYARVGRWHDAIAVNEDAILADDLYLATCRPGPGVYPLGYVPHNHHFLWFAATMTGDSATALRAAAATGERTNLPELLRLPGMEAMQDYASTPLFADVRFGRWDEIQATPPPPDDLPFMVALWHHAQGMAAVRQQRVDDAAGHHAALVEATDDPAIASLMAWERYPLLTVVRIAERVLAAEIAAAAGDHGDAVAALEAGIVLEDSFPYAEPPPWHAPVRHTLGAVLLDIGRAADAEVVYRADLRRNPENGWSLYGLAAALRAQDKLDEAAAVDARFAAAWANADLELTASRL